MIRTNEKASGMRARHVGGERAVECVDALSGFHEGKVVTAIFYRRPVDRAIAAVDVEAVDVGESESWRRAEERRCGGGNHQDPQRLESRLCDIHTVQTGQWGLQGIAPAGGASTSSDPNILAETAGK